MVDDLKDDDVVPSPLATGGAGERFEQRVGAYALALLLTRSTAPILIDSSVVEVLFQTKHLGWGTDDLLIVGETQPGVTRKLAIQAKRSFVVSANDEECVKTIRGMWDDFRTDSRFDASTDKLAIATLNGSSTLLKDFTSLLDCARYAADASDFNRRLGLKGFISQKAKTQNAALIAIIEEHTGAAPDEDLYWHFLRVLTVLSLDLGTATSHSEAQILSLLAHVASDAANLAAAAKSTWNDLLDLASEARQGAGSYRRDALPSDLLRRHHGIATSEDRDRLALIAHGRTVRDSVHTSIAGGYTLDRPSLAAELFDALENAPVVLVGGAAGSGKSALVKKALAHIEAERPVFAFQAVEFATAHIDETLGKSQSSLNAQALLALLAAHDRTVVFVDGVERLLEHSVRDAFAHLLRIAERTTTLRIVLTCRDYSLVTVRSALLGPAGLAYRAVEVGPLSDDELAAVAEGVPALRVALSDPRMHALLRTPYMLGMASRLEWAGTTLPDSVRAFRAKCWRELVRDDAHPSAGMPMRRELVFVDVARKRATELRPFVKPTRPDEAALAALRGASLLDRSPDSDSLYAPAHDVLEDWAILRWLDDVAAAADDAPAALADAVGGFPAMRRGLRRWLSERLEVVPLPTVELVLRTNARVDLPQHFRDDFVVAALLSESAAQFVAGCDERIRAGDINLLRQLVHLLRVACKTSPEWLPAAGLPSIALVPEGSAWAPMLAIVRAHPAQEPAGDALLYLGLVEDWARQVTLASPAPEGVESAGQIVSDLLPLFGGYRVSELRKRLFEVLLRIPAHAPAFADLARRAQSGERDDIIAREFGDLTISTVPSVAVSRDFPEVVMALLRERLLISDDDWSELRSSPDHVDHVFGINDRGLSAFFPASAIQGPFHALLRHHPREALAFILELLNHAGDWYGLRRWPGESLEPAYQTTIEVPDSGPVEQWVNWRLFALYRGLSVGPYALQSALMALEAWLLRIAPIDAVDIEGWLLHILRASNNVMATAVVASVCSAHPTRAGRALLALLSSRDVIQLDRRRMAVESSSSREFLAGLNPSHRTYEGERRTSNALPHRAQDLEMVALRLQLTPWRDAIWQIIDNHRAGLGNAEDDESLVWQLALHRMDVREWREVEAPPAEHEGKEEEARIYLAPGPAEPKAQALVDATQAHLLTINRHLRLLQASREAWERGSSQLDEARQLLEEAEGLEDEQLQVELYARGGPGIVAALCLRDHLKALAPNEFAWCKSRVVREIEGDPDEEVYKHSRMFGPDRAAAAVTALLVAEADERDSVAVTEILALALTHQVDEVADYAYFGAGAFLDDTHGDLVLRCAAAAALEAVVREEGRRAERAEGLFGVSVPDVTIPVAQAVRDALTLSPEQSREVLKDVNLESWAGRKAARRIFTLLERRRHWSEARDFFSRAAQWLADTWEANERGQGNRDFHGEAHFSERIARFVIKLPPQEALAVCAPLLGIVEREPREVAAFLQDLIIFAEADPSGSFWPLWQAFADAALQASWAARLGHQHPKGKELIARLFLLLQWQQGTKHWSPLEANAYRVHALAQRLPPVASCVEAYARFLYSMARQELPNAFVILERILHATDAPEIMSSTDLAYYLESMLSEFVYSQPLRLKQDPDLRKAVLGLLDILVTSGSSAAYRMRDDFVTPLGVRSA